MRGYVLAATQKESFPVQADDPEARAQKRLRELMFDRAEPNLISREQPRHEA